jgi:hypothetical protein
MRDLYLRKEKLAYWINRANTELQEPDKTDVLNFIQFMLDKERSVLWIIRCITALLLMRKHLGKSFRDAHKDDIRSLFKWMNDKNYKASTHEKFRRILKFYYKVVYGNNEHYPEVVNWFSVNLGKEKHGKETNMNIAEYLEEEENQHTSFKSFEPMRMVCGILQTNKSRCMVCNVRRNACEIESRFKSWTGLC